MPAEDLMWMVRTKYYFRRLTVVLSAQEGLAAHRMIPKDKPATVENNSYLDGGMSGEQPKLQVEVEKEC